MRPSSRSPPPRGLAAEILQAVEEGDTASLPPVDLHALWSATTALTQEIKLQGRTFKQLADVLEPLPALAPRVEETLRAIHEVPSMAGGRAEKEATDGRLVDVLLDMRDRLARGLSSAQEARARAETAQQAQGWLARLARRFLKAQEESALAAVGSLEEGYRMGLARLEAGLEELQLSEVPALGRPFDPSCMNAMEVVESSTVPEGTVLEVFRTGYTRRGEVHRTAQVRVARAADR